MKKNAWFLYFEGNKFLRKRHFRVYIHILLIYYSIDKKSIDIKFKYFRVIYETNMKQI